MLPKETEAAHVLRQLAHGYDPVNQMELPMNHVCQHPLVIRALFVAIEKLGQAPLAVTSAPTKPLKQVPENAGKPWDDALDQRLCQAFGKNQSVAHLAVLFNRTEGAIRSRLVRLGKIQP
jgi:hypothetical protein